MQIFYVKTNRSWLQVRVHHLCIFEILSHNLTLHNKLGEIQEVILRSFTNPNPPQRYLANNLLNKTPNTFETLTSISFNSMVRRKRKTHIKTVLSLTWVFLAIVFLSLCVCVSPKCARIFSQPLKGLRKWAKK